MHVPLLRLLATPPVRARRLPRGRDRLRRPAGRGVEPAHRPPADGHRARHLLARARHGAGARRLDRGPRGPAPPTKPRTTWAPQVSPLRRVWSRFFRTLSRLAYEQAWRIVTLSEVNRRKQLADGAPAAKIEIVPNGVVLRDAATARAVTTRRTRRVATATSSRCRCTGRKLRVGFVGRVVPIKDVVTFVRACDLALRTVDLDVRIIGPVEEDPGYAARCRELVERLGRAGADPLRRAEAAGGDLRRSGPGRAHQLQRGPAAGDAGGLRLRRAGDRHRRRRLPRDDRGAHRRGSARSARAASSPASPRRRGPAAALVRLARDARLRRRMGARRPAAGDRLLSAAHACWRATARSTARW